MNSIFVELDDIDRRIALTLQRDAAQPVAAIAEAVGLTANPCWRRIKRLEELGVITHRVARIDERKLGLGLTAFVTIKTDNHSPGWLKAFARTVEITPEIVECHRLAGDTDYLVQIVVRDLSHYDEVYRRFIDAVPDLSDVAATFSMERLKDGDVIDPATAR